jgi:hypothetical protein
MSENIILFLVGAVLLLLGLAKVGQSGGFSLSNIGINFGSTNRQDTKVGDVTPEAAKSGKSDWVGLAAPMGHDPEQSRQCA